MRNSGFNHSAINGGFNNAGGLQRLAEAFKAAPIRTLIAPGASVRQNEAKKASQANLSNTVTQGQQDVWNIQDAQLQKAAAEEKQAREEKLRILELQATTGGNSAAKGPGESYTPAPPAQGSVMPVWGWVLIGVGGLAAITGIVFIAKS